MANVKTRDHSQGRIQRFIFQIRRWLGEPDINAKYDDFDIIVALEECWPEVLTDLYSMAQNPPLARYSLQTVDGQEYYDLPCSVGEIHHVAKLNSDGFIDWEGDIRTHLSPYGPGFEFQGTQQVRIHPAVSDGSCLEVLYIPNGEISIHVGTIVPGQFEVFSTTNFGLSSGTQPAYESIVYGGLDRRPNAYLGSLLHVYWYGGGLAPNGYSVMPEQHRIISGYTLDSQPPYVSVGVPLDFDPADLPNGDTQAIHYEIYPMEAPIVWSLMEKAVARRLLAMEVDRDRLEVMTALYVESKRAAALKLSSMQTRFGDAFNVAIRDNPDYMRGIDF